VLIIVSHAEVQRQLLTDLPLILKVEVGPPVLLIELDLADTDLKPAGIGARVRRIEGGVGREVEVAD
jgi:hypothetical protein